MLLGLETDAEDEIASNDARVDVLRRQVFGGARLTSAVKLSSGADAKFNGRA